MNSVHRSTRVWVCALIAVTVFPPRDSRAEALAAAGTGTAEHAEQVGPGLERLYYDALDENGRLVGGSLVLPVAKPAWAHKARGAVNNRVDIVIVGDGYQAGEQSLFHAHAAAAMATMFSQEPFLTYGPLFNVHEVEVVSADSGVDNDPTQGIVKTTAMHMRFWCSGIERLLCVDVNKAFQFAAAAPDVDQVLALANSTKYGGAGYTVSDLATCAGGNGSAAEIAIHEFGHSIAALADEYDYGGAQTYVGPEPPAGNVSKLNAAAMALAGTKWAAWLGDDNAAFDGLVSTFEGANKSLFGIYRPTNNSKMRNLGRPFNLPSAERLIIETYTVVNPIDNATDTGETLTGSETVFVDPVDPIGNPLTIQWSLDGQPIPGADGLTLDLAALVLPRGSYELSVSVVDNTWMVRNETARSQLMTESRSWAVQVVPILGDVNCDFSLSAADTDALALALIDPAGYAAAYPGCPPGHPDLNEDNSVDGGDIALLVSALAQGP